MVEKTVTVLVYIHLITKSVYNEMLKNDLVNFTTSTDYNKAKQK